MNESDCEQHSLRRDLISTMVNELGVVKVVFSLCIGSDPRLRACQIFNHQALRAAPFEHATSSDDAKVPQRLGLSTHAAHCRQPMAAYLEVVGCHRPLQVAPTDLLRHCCVKNAAQSLILGRCGSIMTISVPHGFATMLDGIPCSC
eukprot:5693926-Amphidinium_carterae.1